MYEIGQGLNSHIPQAAGPLFSSERNGAYPRGAEEDLAGDVTEIDNFASSRRLWTLACEVGIKGSGVSIMVVFRAPYGNHIREASEVCPRHRAEEVQAFSASMFQGRGVAACFSQ